MSELNDEYYERIMNIDLNIKKSDIITNMSNYNLADYNRNCNKNERCTIIFCNIQKVDALWKLSDKYISSNINEVYDPKRFLRVKNALNDLEITAPPFIFLFDNKIEFDDGRKRFSNLRNENFLYMPFRVLLSEKNKIFKLCGYNIMDYTEWINQQNEQLIISRNRLRCDIDFVYKLSLEVSKQKLLNIKKSYISDRYQIETKISELEFKVMTLKRDQKYRYMMIEYGLMPSVS
jgi:hypothetical protein